MRPTPILKPIHCTLLAILAVTAAALAAVVTPQNITPTAPTTTVAALSHP